MEKLYRGSCLCGDVSFEAGGFDARAAHCHCTMCRKFHGAAFGTLVGVRSLEWNCDPSGIVHYTGHNGTVRSFCRRCGSSLAFRVDDQPGTPFEIAISLFDEDIPVNVDAHIFTDYKASWYPITDALPQYGEARDSDLG